MSTLAPSYGRQLASILGHRLAIFLYMAFALFPLFWLVKIAVTPDNLLYSEGIRLWRPRPHGRISISCC